MKEIFRQGINQFVRRTYDLGMLDNTKLRDMAICIDYKKGDYCDIVAMRRENPLNKEYDLVVDFPALPEDDTEAMIGLAGFLSTKLHSILNGSKGGRASSKALSKKERQERARKAGRARWDKQ